MPSCNRCLCCGQHAALTLHVRLLARRLLLAHHNPWTEAAQDEDAQPIEICKSQYSQDFLATGCEYEQTQCTGHGQTREHTQYLHYEGLLKIAHIFSSKVLSTAGLHGFSTTNHKSEVNPSYLRDIGSLRSIITKNQESAGLQVLLNELFLNG